MTKNNYRNMEIIVIDNASNDDTGKLVKQYAFYHPNKIISLYSNRKQCDLKKSIMRVNKKYLNGEIVFLFESVESNLHKDAILKAVKYFNTRSDIDVLSGSNMVKSTNSIAGLYQQLTYFLNNRANKSAAGLKKVGHLNSTQVHILRKDKLIPYVNSNIYRSFYASDIIINRSETSFAPMLTQHYASLNFSIRQFKVKSENDLFTDQHLTARLIGLLTASYKALFGLAILLLPFIIAYFIYLAYRLHQTDFLALSIIVTGLYLGTAIWDDEFLKPRQKLKFILLMPISFVWLYTLSCVKYAALMNRPFSKQPAS